MATPDKTTKILLWIFIPLAVIAIIIGIIAWVKSSDPVVPPTPENPNPPQLGLGNAFGLILSQILNGDWAKNLFGGNACDPAHIGYTKSGKRDTKCDANTYQPSVSNCNPNLCDPLRPSFDQCGNIKMGC